MSLGSFARGLGVVGFTLVRSGASLGSLGSFGRALGVVGFTRVPTGGRRFHTGGSPVHSVHSRAPLSSSDSFWFAGFIRAHPGDHFGL